MRSNKQKEEKSLKDRIQKLITAISDGMYEREEIISVSLLAALCGQNTFLYGPPGTAKSLISRRISCAFHEPAYFEYLMNRFSTPEEVFGPVSIKALKEDRYARKTDSYLPRADFAFLDEIWKSSPAILNTLLTLINERIFKNGEAVEKVPLKALIVASNETPDINQGLEALYDRFIVRLLVRPIGQLQYFESLLSSKPSSAEANVPNEIRIKSDEWSIWLQQIHSVELSTETLIIIHLVREKLLQQSDSQRIYVSDRRWQRAAMLMKAAAFFNGRSETNHSDALLLQHCLWTNEENIQAVTDIVSHAVKASGIDSGFNLAEMDRNKESLDREITEELFYSSDVYKTEKINDIECFQVRPSFPSWNNYTSRQSILIPYGKMKTKQEFRPLDTFGNELHDLKCKFDGQGTCEISWDRCSSGVTYKPDIIFHKGDKKTGINHRLVSALSQSVSAVKSDYQSILATVMVRFSEFESELASPFVPAEKTKLAILGMVEQIESLKLRIKDCERLEELCR